MHDHNIDIPTQKSTSQCSHSINSNPILRPGVPTVREQGDQSHAFPCSIFFRDHAKILVQKSRPRILSAALMHGNCRRCAKHASFQAKAGEEYSHASRSQLPALQPQHTCRHALNSAGTCSNTKTWIQTCSVGLKHANSSCTNSGIQGFGLAKITCAAPILQCTSHSDLGPTAASEPAE